MKQVNRILLCVLAGWAAWLLVNTEALGGSFSVDGPLATVNVGSNQIIMYPHAGLNVERLVLTVSGPGDFYFRQSFAIGNTPFFSAAPGVVDGQYTYELKGIPALLPEDRERLAEVREAGDQRPITELGSAGMLPRDNLLQSGYFTVLQGHFVVGDDSEDRSTGDADPPEGAAITFDVLHYDDVIVTGSICTGFDCANGESFGYCTHKLKENNLQLCFEDTSVGSFPTNDWKIQINDTTSGGGSYFTIWDIDGGRRPFTIEAGAPAHALYVEDYGRIGLGTSTPYVELHIVDGDTPTVRLDQDGSGGWLAQRWDIAGNETNFFIRDVTNGSKLSFRIQPGAPANSLTIKSDGKVGIGTWSPRSLLQVGATPTVDPPDPLPDGKELIVYGDAYIQYSLEIGSSRDLKENINELSSNEAVDALNELKPVRFNYKAKPEEQLGFIAEDVPELVATKNRKSLNTMDIVAVLTRVVQTQQKTITELNRRLDALEHKNLELNF